MMKKLYLMLLSLVVVSAAVGCGFEEETENRGGDGGLVIDDPSDDESVGALSVLQTSGFTAPGSACGSVGESNGSVKLRFAMADDSGKPIAPGTGVDLSGDDVTFTEGSGTLFESPDLQCGAGERGSPASGESSWDGAVSHYDGQCDIGSCSRGTTTVDESGRRCTVETGYSVDSVASVAETDNHDLFGVLVENSASLNGRVPQDHRGWHYDDDADGTADVSVFAQYDGQTDRATDPEGRRHQALDRVLDTWNTVREAARESREVKFGLWTFQGEPDPTSMVDEATGGSGHWTSESQQVDSALEAARSSEAVGRGNVLESITNLLNNAGRTPFSADQYQGLDKTLVVFADGPPALPPGRNGSATVDAAVEAANEAGVRLFVVHLDPALAMGEPQQVLDDPVYYSEQSENCSSDADCRSHETCREVRGFNRSGGGEVNEGRDGTFCMPQRRPDGRTGPLEIYSRLACATGGGYQYIKSADQLSAAMSWLPQTASSLWEADVSVEALQSGNYTSGEANRLQGTLEVTLGGTTKQLEMSQTGGDNRGVIVTE